MQIMLTSVPMRKISSPTSNRIGLSSRQAHVLAAPIARSANEVVALLVLAAGAACPSTDVATTRALRTTQELVSSAIAAFDGARSPARTLRAMCHWVVQALRDAALAAGRLAGITTALAPRAAHEAVTETFAACATRSHTDVAAA